MHDLKIIGIISVILFSGLLVNQAFAVPDNVWNLKEQDLTASAPFIDSKAPICGDESENMFGTRSQSKPFQLQIGWQSNIQDWGGHCFVFKSFNATDIDGKNFTVTWAGDAGRDGSKDSSASMDHHLLVLDGEYIRSNSTDFPKDDGLGFNPSKGAYILQSFNRTGSDFGYNTTGGFVNTNEETTAIDSIALNLENATETVVTLAVSLRDFQTLRSVALFLDEIEIEDFAIWNFDSGASSTQETRVSGVDTGFVTMNFTDQTIIAPVITTTTSQPISIIQDSVFVPLQFLDCSDNIDGDLTGTMTIVGTVNTAIPRGYIVTYTCTDSNSNESELEVQYIVKRISSGGKSDGTRPATLPPPIFTPSEPAPTEVRRAFDLFETLNSLLDFDRQPVEVPQEPTVVPSPTPIQPDTAPPPEPETFVDRLRNFFRGLFG